LLGIPEIPGDVIIGTGCVYDHGVFKSVDDSHTAKIVGEYELINGDTHIKARNKYTLAFVIMLINKLTCVYNSTYGNYVGGITEMYIGTDQSTQTKYNSPTSLVSPIGTAPGTAPNSISTAYSSPSTGVYKFVTTASWNAGTVTGTIGEIAMYGYGTTTLGSVNMGYGSLPTVQMLSRLSVADGEFSATTINVAQVTSVAWSIQLTCP